MHHIYKANEIQIGYKCLKIQSKLNTNRIQMPHKYKANEIQIGYKCLTNTKQMKYKCVTQIRFTYICNESEDFHPFPAKIGSLTKLYLQYNTIETQ